MKRANNKGVSLIEILIAVVIFTLCVTPIIHQLTVGMNISQRADNQQAATDYAKSVAETMKQMELNAVYTPDQLEDLADALGAITVSTSTTENPDGTTETTTSTTYNLTCTTRYYSVRANGDLGAAVPQDSYLISDSNAGTGTGFASVDAIYQTLKTYNRGAEDAMQEALVRQYEFTGSSKIDYRDYDIKIVMDTLPYALASLNTTDYEDPNAANLGNLSDLDVSTTAVITNASNYDSVVAQAFTNSVIAALERAGNTEVAEQYKTGQQKLTNNATKIIEIRVSKLPDGNPKNYAVQCTLRYGDASLYTDFGVPLSDTEMVYEAYYQEFTELPNVYLMYNQFLYNSEYGDDLIRIYNTTDEEAKIYLIRTADSNEGVKNLWSAEGASPIMTTTTNPDGSTETTDTGVKSLLPNADYDRDVKSGSRYMYTTTIIPMNHYTTIYTNIPLEYTDDAGNTVSNVAYHGTPSSNIDNYKIYFPFEESLGLLKPLNEDERYSEAGRVYNIEVSVTNTKTGNTTTIDTSKGDY